MTRPIYWAAIWLCASTCLVTHPCVAEIWSWELELNQAQVRNGPEPDGSTGSPGRAKARLSFDTETNQLTLQIRWQGLVGDLSKLHIHGPVSPSHSTTRHVVEFLGPPEVPPALARTEGSWANTRQVTDFTQDGFPILPRQQVLNILASGNAYLNLHTSVFGMGELRGNLGSPTVTRESEPETGKGIPRRHAD
ncbi:MAG: CHRD domain-containing protein [Myxococcota bacterium]